MDKTSFLELNKPQYPEDADVGAFNENMDQIDQAVESLTNTVNNKVTRPSGGAAGKVLEYGNNGAIQWGDKLPTRQVVQAVEEWLTLNVPTQETVVVDDTLSISGAAADSKVTGDRFEDIEEAMASLTDVYTQPEDFGAVGDGNEDDTDAIQAAIDYGRSNNTAVRGFKVYKTTRTISIQGNYMDVYIHRLNYNGYSNALTVRGSYHQLMFGSIYCNNGAGVVYAADSNGINRVNFKAGRIYCANGHCVDLQTYSDRWILYNTFDIRDLRADNGDCFHGMQHVGENVYYNSSCACPNGWAIYYANGRYHNFTLEGNVLNGINLQNGYSYFTGFRVRELVDKLVRRMSGLDPTLQGGTLIKYDGADYCISKFVCDDFIPYDAIDVSTMITPEEALEAQDPDIDVLRRFTYYNEIDAPIRVGYYGTRNGYFTPGHKMIVQGGRKICVPDYEVEYTITNSTYDLRDPLIDNNTVKVYPTRMVIGVDNCVIYLPTSYNPVGYSSFIVDQSSHTCTIYDYNDTTQPAFDGASWGKGIYKLTAYTNLDNNVIQKLSPSNLYKQFDSSNYYWKIEKVGSSGGGVVSVAEYGAVGDGVTDDSSAIQAAINANYDVYFESNKTYFIRWPVNINHSVRLHGGDNTTIKTATPTNGVASNAFVCNGTLKKTTTLTTDYKTVDATDNSGNMFTLSDMTGINIGDIMVIEATDQYYSYARQYYYLGGVLLVSDIYNGHIYTSNSLPFDITNTANVTAKIYSAPEIIVENLHFVSDQLSRGNYRFFVTMNYCKNSVVRDCHMTNMDSGVRLNYCVNSLVDNVSISKSKYDNSLNGDGYGIYIFSCSNTEIKRVMAICAQGCLDLGGYIPNIDTFVRECNLNSECRAIGIDMHENSYNIVVEDCTLGGLSLYGTAEVNRCRFIKNNRVPTSATAIVFRGSHDERWAKMHVSNCVFDGDMGIQLMSPSPQTPIQAFDNIFGNILIENCEGGEIVYNGTVSSNILSHNIKNMVIKSWKNCRRFLRTSVNLIDKLTIIDSSFRANNWITDNVTAHGLYVEGIKDFYFSSTFPRVCKISVDQDVIAERRIMSNHTPITVSSSNSSAKYIACGANLVSNVRSDYILGSVSGSVGGNLNRTPASFANPPELTVNSDGSFVYTQQNNTSQAAFIPFYTAYMPERGNAQVKAILKNIGSTEGASFRLYIVIFNPETGKIAYIGNGAKVTATSAGAEVSHSYGCSPGMAAIFYVSCATPVANSVTRIEGLSFGNASLFDTTPTSDAPFIANRRTGNGILPSVTGVNNIMSSETSFHVKFKADQLY